VLIFCLELHWCFGFALNFQDSGRRKFNINTKSRQCYKCRNCAFRDAQRFIITVESGVRACGDTVLESQYSGMFYKIIIIIIVNFNYYQSFVYFQGYRPYRPGPNVVWFVADLDPGHNNECVVQSCVCDSSNTNNDNNDNNNNS
jgi:hypothetical protein